jgi:hypothetical protein
MTTPLFQTFFGQFDNCFPVVLPLLARFFREKIEFFTIFDDFSKNLKILEKLVFPPKPDILPPNQRLIKIATLREERGVMGTCARDFGHKMSRF